MIMMPIMRIPSRSSLALAVALCTLACPSLSQAQQVYRIVSPDGKVTFSDRAPNESATPALTTSPNNAPSDTSALPYTLRQVAERFPVTIYTGADCAPCVSARSLLIGRGIPFTEYSVSSNEDIDALKRLSGNSSLPFATIGSQHLTGFSDSEWTQYLDAADYPKKSELPSNYRQRAVTPLVASKSIESKPTTQDPAPYTPRSERPMPAPTAPTDPGPSNPAGIRF
jgi:glutaredoxin